ncbi:MAG: hypothetical protein ABIL58_25890 [Pseudomonadota bacterium]
MKVIFYSTTMNGCIDRLKPMLLSLVSEKHMAFTNDIEDFTRALVKYRPVRPIVVIHVNSDEDVAEVKELDNMLDDLFLIIITENDSKAVLMSCRRLYPRWLSHADDDLGIVTAVIEKRLADHG